MAECANNRIEMASVAFPSRLNDQQHDKVSLKLYFREGVKHCSGIKCCIFQHQTHQILKETNDKRVQQETMPSVREPEEDEATVERAIAKTARAAAAGGRLTIRLKQKPKSVLTAETAAGPGSGGGVLFSGPSTIKADFLLKATPMKRSTTRNLRTDVFVFLGVFFLFFLAEYLQAG